MGSIKHPKKSAGGRLGKIDAPLGKKLQAVKWGEYRLGDLFDVLSYKQRFDANKVTLVENSGHPYIVRQGSDNGQKGFIDENEIYLNDGNTISFGQDTATMFYQEKPYFTGDKIKILKPKMERFSKDNAQFFLATMRRSFSNFSWGTSSFSIGVIENQNITLPITADNQIDFDFIESFIRELEEERVRELAAYLTASGLADTTLTASEQAALNAFDTLEWGEFRIGDLFEKIKVKSLKYKTNDLPSVANKEFDLPALTAGIQNQGLNNYVPRENATILKNVISISANGANTGATFYQSKDFTVLQDSYAIKWIYSDVDLTDTQYLFLVGAISKRIYGNYEWTNKAGWERIKTNTISLPQTVDNQIDYAIMQDFISAVQKLVIKDVVAYADRKIAATKAVVGKM